MPFHMYKRQGDSQSKKAKTVTDFASTSYASSADSNSSGSTTSTPAASKSAASTSAASTSAASTSAKSTPTRAKLAKRPAVYGKYGSSASAQPCQRQPIIAAPRRFFLLCLPLCIFLLIAYIYTERDITYRQAALHSTVTNGVYGKYLYVNYKVNKLLSDKSRVDEYYYRLVEIENQSVPYVILSYRVDEAASLEPELAHLPRRFTGRIDTAGGEDHELIKKYLVRPALQQGYPSSLAANMYYVFNISRFTYAYRYRNAVILIIIIILAALPITDNYFRRRSQRNV